MRIKKLFQQLSDVLKDHKRGFLFLVVLLIASSLITYFWWPRQEQILGTSDEALAIVTRPETTPATPSPQLESSAQPCDRKHLINGECQLKNQKLVVATPTLVPVPTPAVSPMPSTLAQVSDQGLTSTPTLSPSPASTPTPAPETASTAQNLIINGDFEKDSQSWTPNGAITVISNPEHGVSPFGSKMIRIG